MERDRIDLLSWTPFLACVSERRVLQRGSESYGGRPQPLAWNVAAVTGRAWARSSHLPSSCVSSAPAISPPPTFPRCVSSCASVFCRVLDLSTSFWIFMLHLVTSVRCNLEHTSVYQIVAEEGRDFFTHQCAEPISVLLFSSLESVSLRHSHTRRPVVLLHSSLIRNTRAHPSCYYQLRICLNEIWIWPRVLSDFLLLAEVVLGVSTHHQDLPESWSCTTFTNANSLHCCIVYFKLMHH